MSIFVTFNGLYYEIGKTLYRNMKKYLLLIILGWWTMAVFAVNSELPDSMVTEDKVYEYTFSDTPLAERIMAELRNQGKQSTYELDITEGDLYIIILVASLLQLASIRMPLMPNQ